MKTYAIILMWALLAFSLSLAAGCKDDNSDNGGNGTDTGKLISRIDEYNGDSQHDSFTEFTYDANNRLVKQVDKYTGQQDADTTLFSYPTSTTIIINNSGYGITATLNSAGYIIQLTPDEEVGKIEFSYENGYLIKMTTLEPNEDIPPTTTVYTVDYSWENGNMKTALFKEETIWEETQTYIYAEKLNNHGNLDINFLDSDVIEFTPFGWFGKPSKNLIAQINYQSSYDVDSSTFVRYETDTDGYVTKIYVREGNGSEALRYKITYK